MLSSSSLSWALTVVFVLTGVFALGRLAALTTNVSDEGDRLAELSHLLMSLAMVAMVWAWGGGPSSPSGIVQLVVFGLLAACFLVLTVRPDPGHGRREGAYHLLMAGSMVWMVAAMPLLMGSTSEGDASGGGHAGHAGHDMADMPGMSTAEVGAPGSPAGPPGWALVVSAALTVALAAATVFWAGRVVRARLATGPAEPRPENDGPERAGGPRASGTGATALGVAHAPTTGASLLADPRAGALCHVLTSAGMAGMLAAML